MVVVDGSGVRHYKYLCSRCKGKNYLIQCKCGYCNDIIIFLDKWGDPRQFQKGHSKRMENHHMWRDGKATTSFEYINIRVWSHPFSNSRGYVRQHRLIYENYLSILMDEEVFIPKIYDVHHIDGNKQNNSLVNLQLISKKEHTKLHRLGKRYYLKDYSDYRCLLCGTDKTCFNGRKRPFWISYKDGHICNACYKRNRRRHKKMSK